MERNDEVNNANEHNMVKNPHWQEADQLVIYKCARGVELGITATSGFIVRSPKPLSHAASLQT